MEEPPPPDRYAELRERFEGTQLLVTPQIDLYYFWMNVNKPPFDDVRVRRAVNYAIDPAALERIYARPDARRPSRSCRRRCRATAPSTPTRTTWRRRAR